MDPKYKNMARSYNCENCGTLVNAPMHCGHAMHIEEHNGGKSWLCWMQTSCGMKSPSPVQDYNACCSNPKLNAV